MVTKLLSSAQPEPNEDKGSKKSILGQYVF